MSEIDREIENLERQLLEKKAARSRMRSEALDQWNIPQPVFVSSPEEMRFDLLPELAQVVLDNIPVQIFIKNAEFVPGHGRRYIYLNAIARKILGWKPEEVTQHYDSEAVAGGIHGREYETMKSQEDVTLAGQKSRRTQLEWTSQAAAGGWRRNQTLEISILDHGHNTIGFCAVAEDILFQSLPSIHSWLSGVFQHEYNNAGGQVILQTYNVERALRDALAASEQTGSARQSIEELAGRIRPHLDVINRRMQTSSSVSKALIDAFAKTYSSKDSTVRKVLADLERIYRTPPCAMEISADDASHAIRVRKPEAVIGVLVELVGNALKHSEQQHWNPHVKLRAERVEGGVDWVVSNKPGRLKGRLEIRKIEELPEDRGDKMGSAVISELLSRAFPSENPVEMIQFPDRLDEDGWLHIRFLTSEDPKIPVEDSNDAP